MGEAVPKGTRVVNATVPAAWDPQRHPRAIGMLSVDSDELPVEWLPKLALVDELWVPNSANVETFERFCARPVVCVRPGIDSSAFAYRARERGEKLRFLHVAESSSDYQGGGDLAVKAFADAFGRKRDDVELVLHGTWPGYPIPISDGRISRVVARLPIEERAELYRGFDALIYTSRGDGVGRVPLEAMATGLPVIYAAAGGLADLAPLGLPVGARRVPATSSAAGAIRSTSTTPFGWWAEAHHDDLVARIREIDLDYDSVTTIAATAAETIATEYSWDGTAAAIAARLAA